MKKENGFTLVELSIVLVIIGLLIGGILSAQSMIGTAKINAFTQQISQFDAGVMGFKARYNYLPGDAPGFGGDGNGIIGDVANADQTNIFSGEVTTFWNNFDPTNYTTGISGYGSKAVYNGTGKNVPTSKIGSNSFVSATSICDCSAGAGGGPANADTANKRNFYMVVHGSQVQDPLAGYYAYAPTTSVNSSTNPADLLALDQKIDDSIGNSGNVISGKIVSAGGVGGGGAPTPYARTQCSSVAGVYAVQNTGNECTPMIRIGAQAGEPQ